VARAETVDGFGASPCSACAYSRRHVGSGGGTNKNVVRRWVRRVSGHSNDGGRRGAPHRTAVPTDWPLSAFSLGDPGRAGSQPMVLCLHRTPVRRIDLGDFRRRNDIEVFVVPGDAR
jgi:hypothetical protein